MKDHPMVSAWFSGDPPFWNSELSKHSAILWRKPKLALVGRSEGPWKYRREKVAWSTQRCSSCLLFQLQPTSAYNCMSQNYLAESFLNSWSTETVGPNAMIIIALANKFGGWFVIVQSITRTVSNLKWKKTVWLGPKEYLDSLLHAVKNNPSSFFNLKKDVIWFMV